jgi:type IV pilus assembly protein PilM/plasmid segregation protein ParM
LKFGLAPDRLEGQVYRAVEGTLENFVSELIKSIKFFQTRYPSIAVGGILLSGFTLTIPRLIEYIGAKTQIQTAAANPWQKVRVNQGVQQQLLPIANEFATVVGLAQRVGKI